MVDIPSQFSAFATMFYDLLDVVVVWHFIGWMFSMSLYESLAE